MRSIRRILSLLIIYPFWASAQNVGMNGLEKEIFAVLSRDSISPVVSYLPPGRNFGIAELSADDQLVIVKIGRDIRLVSQETGHVYGLVSGEGSLTRLDSNNVFGLEYRIDPFVRKDTMFMVATSHFLKGKGFLAYFEPSLHDWKAYRGNDAVIKETTRPFYDPMNDQLYLVCNYVFEEPIDTAKASMDNVMRYSFAKGEWEVLGRLDADVYESAIKIPVEHNWNTSFGVGNLEGGDLNIVQPDKNRWLSTDSNYRSSRLRDINTLAEQGKLLQLIYMGDTLYAFSGTEDDARVDRLAVQESDFIIPGSKALYAATGLEPSKERKGMFPNWIFVLLAVAILGLALLWTRQRNRKTVSSVATERPGASATMPETQTSAAPMPASKRPVHYFLESLTPVERSLVLELARYAKRGDMMDTQSLNQILGVSQKEAEVQKVRRSLTITRINSNFGQMLEPDTALIRREKDPADKRVFLYYVTQEHAGILLEADGSTA